MLTKENAMKPMKRTNLKSKSASGDKDRKGSGNGLQAKYFSSSGKYKFIQWFRSHSGLKSDIISFSGLKSRLLSSQETI